MALQNDPRLFTGGSERIDTRPHVQLYAQLKQREQARNDAFDEYMRNLNLKINPAGMRNKERIPFEEKLKEWQQKSIQNRDRIRDPRKDNGLAQMENQSGFQELLNMAAESKTAAEGLKPFIEVRTDPKKAALLNNDRAMAAVQSHDQPIYVKDESGRYVRNPAFKPFNASELEFHPEEFDVPKYLKNLDYIKPTDKTEEIISTDPKTLMNKVKITSKFTPNDYDKMATIGVQTYYSDPSMKMLVDRMYNDPKNKEVLKLNEVFKSKFKKDISNEGDLAAAMTIAAKETTEQELKMEEDRFAQDKYLAGLRHGYAVALKKTPGAPDDNGEDDGLYIQKWIRNASINATTGEQLKDVLRGGGTPIKGRWYKLPLNTIIRKALNVQGVEPEETLVREKEDGEFEYQPKYYENVPILKKDGTPELNPDGTAKTVKKLINDLSNTRSETDFLLDLGVKATTGKQRYAEGQAAVRGQQQQSGYSNQQPATYKGKKITAGVKNGKWYNIQTGEELK